jgi:hypothetical protein
MDPPRPIMGFFHTAYGLRLHSNQLIPGLASLSSTGNVDISVSLQSPPPVSALSEADEHWYTSPYLNDEGAPTVEAWRVQEGQYYKLRYSDKAEFIIDSNGEQIWASWPATLSLEDIAVYLLGPILGFVLRLRGMTCLHASVVCMGEDAFAFFGPAGSGKSTTAAAFSNLGHSILADDIAALKETGHGFSVQPGYPHLRLWPSSVQFLYGHREALPQLVPGSAWDKCFLNLAEKEPPFQERELPLAGAYFLDERTSDSVAPAIHPMSQSEVVIGLVANSYANYMLDRGLRAREFVLLSRLSKTIPTRRIVPHSDPSRLQDMCALILDDIRNHLTRRHSLDND